MNRLILEESESKGDSLFCLNSRKSNHIIKILKSQVGDQLKAGLLNQSIGTAFIHSINLKERQVIVQYVADNNGLLTSHLDSIRIFSALQRPQTVKKIVQLSATCGISELFFFPAEKSEFSYLHSSVWSERNLLDEIILGLEQGGRVKIPTIRVLKNKFMLKTWLIESNRFLLDFKSKTLLDSSLSIDFQNPIQFIIGPESGFTEEDIHFFSSLNFERISVSENILRSETALAFVLSQIELLKSRST